MLSGCWAISCSSSLMCSSFAKCHVSNSVVKIWKALDDSIGQQRCAFQPQLPPAALAVVPKRHRVNIHCESMCASEDQLAAPWSVFGRGRHV